MKIYFTLIICLFFSVAYSQAPDPALCCDDAPIICEFNLLNGYTAMSLQQTNTCGPSPLCPNNGNTVANNISWWGFVAGSNSVSVTVDPYDCNSGDGLQFGIYESCTFNGAIDCISQCGAGTDPAPMTIASDNFVPGQTYYVFIDGCNGDVCQYEVTINYGGDPIEVPEADDYTWEPVNLLGDTICEGAEGVPFSTPLPNGIEPSYFWILDGDTLGSSTNNVFLDFPVAGEFELCVLPYTACDTASVPACHTIYVEHYATRFDTTILCEEDFPYDWEGLSVPGGGDFTQEFEDNFTCPYDLQMTFIELESYTDPDEIVYIDTAICYGDLFTDIPGHVFIDPTDEDVLIQTVPQFGLTCDSIVHLTLAVVDGVADPAEIVCIDGEFEIFVPVPYIAPDDATYYIVVYNNEGDVVVTSDANTNSVTVLDEGYYNIVLQVEYDGVYCERSSEFVTLDLSEYLPQTIEIVGPTDPCANDLSEYIAVIPNAEHFLSDPASCILWNLPTGATDVSFPECDSILIVDWGDSPGGTIEVFFNNVCGESGPFTIDVNLDTAPTPEAGQDDATCGDTYSLNATSPTSNGYWNQFSGPGSSVFADVLDPQSTVTVPTFGTYVYTWVEGTGNCVDSAQVEITYGPPPMIDGVASEDCDNTTLEYTVTFNVDGGTAPYVVITGGGSFTGSTYTSGPFPSGPYFIEITDQNNCDTVTVSGTNDCLCVTNAGEMVDVTKIDLCEDQDASSLHNAGTEVSDGDDIGSYVLHTNAGSGLGTIIDQNATGTFSFNSGSMAYETEYYISFIFGSDDLSGNVNLADGCLSVASGTPVVWHKNPVPQAGNDDSTCGLVFALNGTADVGSGLWSMTAGPGSAVFDATNLVQTNVTVTQPGDYTFIWEEDNFGCVGSDDVTITFIENPSINNSSISFDCDDTNTSYTVSFTITGGDDQSYSVIGGTGALVGSVFTSDPILSTGTFDFGVYDINQCDTFYISGDHLCNCDTEVGTMDLNKIAECGDGPITALYDNTNQVLDGDDIVYYYMHSASGNTLGTIFASGPAPTFSFQSGTMTYGVSYYISAVAGNEDVSGEIDFSDGCRKVSPGTEIVFYEVPKAIISAATNTLSCLQSSLDLDGSGSISTPGVTYTWSTSDGSIQSGQDQSIATINSPGTYTLLVTSIDGLCEHDTTIVIDEQADVPVVNFEMPEVLSCATLDITIDASSSTGGNGIEYVWTTVNGNIIGGQGTTNLNVDAPGMYILTINDANNGCQKVDSIEVLLDDAIPTADASSPDELTCDNETVVINGTGSSMGIEYTYMWSTTDGNILSGETTLAPEVGTAGMYTLIVLNTLNGCSDTTEVAVIANGDVIAGVDITPIQPTCNGDSNGTINIDNIQGGTPPYNITFNSVDVGTQTFFDNLAAGSHSILIEDANGCTFPMTEILPEPAKVEIDVVKSYILNKGEDLDVIFNSITIDEDSIANIEIKSLQDSSVLIFSDLNINFAPATNGQYLITVTDNAGCTDTDQFTVQIAVDHSVFFPNIFSPNGDGKNDRFSVFAGPEVASVSNFLVFNRWGEKVYESRNFVPSNSIGWNGTFKGEKMQPGIYVYHAEIVFTDGVVVVYNGEVFLAR